MQTNSNSTMDDAIKALKALTQLTWQFRTPTSIYTDVRNSKYKLRTKGVTPSEATWMEKRAQLPALTRSDVEQWVLDKNPELCLDHVKNLRDHFKWDKDTCGKKVAEYLVFIITDEGMQYLRSLLKVCGKDGDVY
jgi:hypothetical protein